MDKINTKELTKNEVIEPKLTIGSFWDSIVKTLSSYWQNDSNEWQEVPTEFSNKTSYLDFVESKFIECFREKWYSEEPAVEITSQVDKTVDFVWSKISTLKKYLLNEDFWDKWRFLIQNSMKLKNLKSLKDDVHQVFWSYYKCMWILAKPDLNLVVNDTFDYFLDSKYLDIPPENLCIKINSNDVDLMEAISSLDPKILREIDKSPVNHYVHRYWMDDRNISWRDFNIGVKKKWTDEFFTCATFVIMGNWERNIAIDMWIGNLSLSMCKFWEQSTIASSRIADIIQIKNVMQEKFADSLIAVATLLKEDIINHKSRHFRKKFRIFVSALNYRNKQIWFNVDELVEIIVKYLNMEYLEDFSKYKDYYKYILNSYKNI